MSSKPYAYVNRSTPQTAPLIGGTPQVENNAGGFVYKLDIWATLLRFLILGTEGGTFYVGEQKLTREAAANVLRCIKEDGIRTVNTIVEVSDGGRAPKNDPAIFALALAAAAEDVVTRQYALAALPRVCRIPTHLFHFNQFVEQFRGRGRSLNRAMREWYQAKPIDELAYALVKYQQRDGWSHRDIFRLVKPKPKTAREAALYRWAVGKGIDAGKELPPNIVLAFEEAKSASKADLIRMIVRDNLSREMVPTAYLSDPDVQEALLERMPPHALLRNLGNLGKSGLLKPLSAAAKTVVDKLSDHASLRKRRVHPVDILVALKVYGQGHGMKGSGTWAAVQPVIDALDEAFYAAFGFIEPTGLRYLFGVDVSGSMSTPIAGLPISSAEAAAVMAMVCARQESQYLIHGFTASGSASYYRRTNSVNALDGFVDLGITAKDDLRTACAKVQKQNFGSTDCSIPMLYAMKERLDVDCFAVITDNETYAGSTHPSQALKAYRNASGIRAKQVVIATAATPFSIADPNDPLTLDVVGFDTATPQAISEFVRS